MSLDALRRHDEARAVPVYRAFSPIRTLTDATGVTIWETRVQWVWELVPSTVVTAVTERGSRGAHENLCLAARPARVLTALNDEERRTRERIAAWVRTLPIAWG